MLKNEINVTYWTGRYFTPVPSCSSRSLPSHLCLLARLLLALLHNMLRALAWLNAHPTGIVTILFQVGLEFRVFLLAFQVSVCTRLEQRCELGESDLEKLHRPAQGLCFQNSYELSKRRKNERRTSSMVSCPTCGRRKRASRPLTMHSEAEI